jgi:hypothetical protein
MITRFEKRSMIRRESVKQKIDHNVQELGSIDFSYKTNSASIFSLVNIILYDRIVTYEHFSNRILTRGDMIGKTFLCVIEHFNSCHVMQVQY